MVHILALTIYYLLLHSLPILAILQRRNETACRQRD
jgi:hypothetical protein